jgi:DNA ligase D-like protein (predicted polymerase)
VAAKDDKETRDGVAFSNLDQPVFPDAGVTKRDLVDYLDAMSDRIIPVLRDRPLSVIRVQRESAPFMQKNLPKYTPDFVERITLWAETSKRDVSYALCNDRSTLLWFANQRAVEYHPTLVRADRLDRATHLILDIDPPAASDLDPPSGVGTTSGRAAFDAAVRVAHLVHQALDDVGLQAAVKTSGAKGVHIFVPVDVDTTTMDDAAAATRAIAARAEAIDPGIATTAFVKDEREGKVFVDSTRVGGATVVAAYSPRARPGLPVSFPVSWEELDDVDPSENTVRTAVDRLAGRDPWSTLMPKRQRLSDDLVAEGHAIPVSRVQAMHEGKRRKRAQRDAGA